MAKSAQKIKATTQHFTEIKEISENVVLFENGAACSILEVTATNFALQSQEEQQVKILSYASLLNSLSFQIQIFITNKKLDISGYVKKLDQASKTASNPSVAQQISLYKDFVSDLVKNNTVLDKKFYIVVPFSPLEQGVTGAKAGALGASADSGLLSQAKINLKSKVESIAPLVSRINLKARILEKDDLIHVFYEIYNGNISSEAKLSEYEDPIVEGHPIPRQQGAKV